uniref:39S ribosomal protein L20, mitochondrial n=2 Tax=Acrobeloides nanus TaxID=290746 RepID=A0A914DZU1_9BILA
MKLTVECCLRRILNSSYHPFSVIPKPSVWPRRERIRRLTAWQYSSKRDTFKAAVRRLDKVFHYMTMQRIDEPKLERFYAFERVQTALTEHDMEYKYFRSMLDKSHILLDNITLSQLAIYEPLTFKSLVMLTKQMAIKEGIPIVKSVEQDNVLTEESLFQDPLPRARLYPKGPDSNYKTKEPRPLKLSEY